MLILYLKQNNSYLCLIRLKQISIIIELNMISDQLATKMIRRPKLVRDMHLLMIGACVLASFALYLVTATFYKVVIAAILVAYTVFITVNSQIIRLIFQIPFGQEYKNYDISRPWSIDQCANSQKKVEPKEIEGNKVKPVVKAREDLNTSSVEQSFDIRDVSISVYKAMNSEIHGSRLNSSKKIESRDSHGFDLDELPIQTERMSQKSILKSRISSQKGIVIQDRRSIATESSYRHRQQNQRQYENQLHTTIKKGAKEVQSRYKFILSIIQRFVNPILAENRFNSEKLRETFLEFLDVSLADEKNDPHNIDVENYGVKSRPMATNFQFCLLQTYLLAFGKIRGEQFDIPLKAGKNIEDLHNKCMVLIRARLNLAAILGVDSGLVASNNLDSVKQFIRLYNQYIGMVSEYVERELPNKNRIQKEINQYPEDRMDNQFKNKLYVLYLFIKEININLRISGKIKFSDFMNFSYPQKENYEFEVYPKVMFDSFSPHFNIYKINEQQRQLCYNCQPGQNNYLSVIYFLIYSFSLRPDILYWNQTINRYVHEIL